MPAKKKSEVVALAVQAPKAKRTFRTIEERIAEVERKIQFHQRHLSSLIQKRPRSELGDANAIYVRQGFC